MLRLISIFMALSVATCASPDQTSPSGTEERPLLVSAATSLTDALEVLADGFELETGMSVELNLASSSTLASQIIAGAPVDLFISADLFQMERLGSEGLVRSETRVDLLSNQLVIVLPLVSSDVATTVTSAATLREPEFERIAIGDPAGVPVGVYARTYLESVGLWEALQERIVPTRNTRAALATVETGAADAGIVYRTDAMSSDDVRVVFEVPIAEGPPIAYPAALTTETRNPAAARRLLAYLQGPEARAVFERAGFVVPEGQSAT